MDVHDYAELSRHARAEIVLRADLRTLDLAIDEGGRRRAVPAAVAKSVLFVLDSFPPDRCYPSEDLIATGACTTVRTLRRVIRALTEADVLYVTARAAKGRRFQSSNLYRIRFDVLAELDPRRAAPAHGAAPATRSPGPPGRAAPAHRAAQPRPTGPTTTASGTQHVVTTALTPGRADSDVELLRWMTPIAPRLLALGIDKRTVVLGCREAGSAERVEQVIRLIGKRRASIESVAAYFLAACRNGWT